MGTSPRLNYQNTEQMHLMKRILLFLFFLESANGMDSSDSESESFVEVEEYSILCTNTYKQQSALENASDELKYNFCNKQCTNQISLQNHKNICEKNPKNEGKTFLCEFCGEEKKQSHAS